RLVVLPWYRRPPRFGRRFPMTARSWIGKLFARPPRSRRNPVRLRVEALEDRLTPSNFVVQNTNDTGPGSLRDGITQANTNTDPSPPLTSAPGVTGTIPLASALPALAADISMLGPGAKVLTVARSAVSPASFSVFTVHSGVSVTLSGLTITGGSAED